MRANTVPDRSAELSPRLPQHDIFPLRMMRGDTKAAGLERLSEFGIGEDEAQKIISSCRRHQVDAFLAFRVPRGSSLQEAVGLAETIMSEQYGERHLVAFVHERSLEPVILADFPIS